MVIISLRLDANEEKLFRNYAKMHNMTISELLRSSAIEKIEKIENEIDLSSFDSAMTAMTKTCTLAEAKDELGLS